MNPSFFLLKHEKPKGEEEWVDQMCDTSCRHFFVQNYFENSLCREEFSDILGVSQLDIF